MTVLDPSTPMPSPTQAPVAVDAKQSPIRRRLLLAAILLGLGLRVALAAVCWGTNDANTFGQFGFYITRDGLIPTYIGDAWLNHPPIPSYWSEAAWRLTVPDEPGYDPGNPVNGDNHYISQLTDTPGRYFSAVFKIPTLLAECATVWLLYRLWRDRAGKSRGLAVAAMYAWSLDAILVSGYHCNTDPIYAFFCLLCVYLLQDKRSHFLAGLALAAAINVKLTPVLLILPLLLWHRSWQSAWKFVLGLAIGALPFVPVLLLAGKPFYANAIAYKSNPDNWGITCLLMQADKEPGAWYEFVPKEHPLASFYFDYGRYAVLALIAGWAVAARLRRREDCEKQPIDANQLDGFDQTTAGKFRTGAATGSPTLSYWIGPRLKQPFYDAYTIAAVTLAIFLFFTPGFGVQYTVIVLPLLFAVWPGMANAYGLVAGLFLAVIYWAHWPGHHWPPNSQFAGMFPRPARVYGLVAWGLLGYFTLRAVFTRRAQLGYISLAGAKLSGK
jgi:hypothetical protein